MIQYIRSILLLGILFMYSAAVFGQGCLLPTQKPTTSITTNSATLNWTHPNFSTISGFEIEIGIKPLLPLGIPNHTVSGQDSSLNIMALQAAKTYQYYIRANCTNGNSNWAGPFEFTTAIPNPSACKLNLPITEGNCAVSGNFLVEVNGVSGTLGDNLLLDEVKIIIRHTWDDDVEIRLISPWGQVVELSTDNGGGLDNYGTIIGSNCINYTTFVNSKTHCNRPIIYDGVPPFAGQFLPEGELNDFNTGSHSANGIWTLQVCDDVSDTYKGTLDFVELRFSNVACVPPSNVVASNTDVNSTHLTWSAGSATCQQTIIEYGSVGFVPGAGATAGGGTLVTVPCPVSQPFILSGLSSNTNYDIYIREECLPGNFSGNSCKINIATACPTPPISHLENFNAQSLCNNTCGALCPIADTWHNALDDDFDWTVAQLNTPTDTTGPSDDVSGGGRYIYIETSNTCTGGKKAALVSNCMQISSNTDDCHLSFYYNMFGSNVDSLLCQISFDGGDSWITLWQRHGDIGNDLWYRQYIDLGVYHGQIAQFRFVATTANGIRGDIGLDEITFYGSIDLGHSAYKYYRDADNDGYGNFYQTTFSCLNTPPSGYVTNSNDCNDSNNAIYPSAIEVGCNQQDDNCNGIADDVILPTPIIRDTFVCSGSSITLAADNLPTSNNFWFDDTNTGIATGVTFTTPILNNTTTFSVKDSLIVATGLKITEIDLNDPDRIEIQSLGIGGNYSGWVVAVSNSFNNINSANATYWALGNMATNEILYRTDLITDNYIGTDVVWNTNFPGWAIILDDAGNVRDAIFWNWAGSDIMNFNTTINGHTITAMDLPWYGNGVATAGCTLGNTLSLATMLAARQSNDYNPCAITTIGSANAILPIASVCKSDETYFNVEVHAQADLTINNNTTICSGDSLNLSTSVNDSNNTGSTISFHTALPPSAGNQLNNTSVSPNNNTTYFAFANNTQQCTDTIPVTVTVNTIPVISILPNTIISACENSPVQLNTILTMGAITPLSYLWNIGDTTANISVNANAIVGASDVYQVTVTNGDNCSSSASATIHTVQSITSAMITGSLPAVCNANTGSLTVSPQGGMLPYDYAWSGPVSGSINNINGNYTIPNLFQGVYTITITDNTNFGCQYVLSNVVVNGIGAQVNNITTTDIICNGDNTGTIDLDVNTGGQPTTYNWSNGVFTQDIANLNAGFYSVTINTSGAGCSLVIDSIEIKQPRAIAIVNPLIVSPTCFGSNNGFINISVVGGVTPYSFAWSTQATTADIGNLSAGDYLITITDVYGCEFEHTFVLSQPDSLILNTELLKHITCFGANDGQIDIQPDGGTAPYSYNWNINVASEDLSSLAPGNYAVTATDANGCLASKNFTIVEYPALVITPTVQQISCFGLNDGSIAIDASGGLLPYSYAWSSGATNNSIHNLPQGSYAVTITDAAGCKRIRNFSIHEPQFAFVIDSVKNAACVGVPDGFIQISFSGGQQPYHYQWNNQASTQDLDSLDGGVYQLTISDSNNCTFISDTLVITVPQVFSFSADYIQDVECYGALKGAIYISIDGGTSPFDYNWNNGFYTNQDLVKAPAGNYSCVITDAYGCQFQTPHYTINQASPIVINLLSSDSASCYNSTDGALSVAANGGTAPYTYIWSSAASTAAISQLVGGDYIVVVTDDNSCVVSDTFSVARPTPIEINVLNITASSCAIPTGGIDIAAIGGYSPYTYSWNTTATTQDLTNISANSYTVTVTDANQCTSVLQYITVMNDTQNALQVVPLAISPVSCFGMMNGCIEAQVTNGVAPYDFNWSSGTDTDGFLPQDKDTLCNLAAGTYRLTVTDGNGCVGIVNNLQVTTPQAFNINLDALGAPTCVNTNNGSIHITPSGGTMPNTFLWSNGQTTEDIANLIAMSYRVTITDVNNCQTVSPWWNLTPVSHFQIDSIRSTPSFTYASANGTASVFVSNGIAPFTYLWDTNANNSNQPFVHNLAPNNYFVTITDNIGCALDTFVTVEVTVGVAETFAEQLSCEVFPNPSITHFTLEVSMPSAEDVVIELIDILGRQIFSNPYRNAKAIQQTFSTTALHDGLYLLQLKLADGTLLKTKKIIVHQ